MNDFVEGFHFVFDNWTTPFAGLDISLSGLTVEHVLLSLKAMAVAVVIGVPLGMFLGHLHRFSFLAINISNLGRALPSLGIISILLPLTGINENTVIIALVVLAAPPILTNTYVAIDQVDADTVDAARGLGLNAWQILLRVELPLGLPLIFAGIRTSTVFVVATATLSGFFGGGGLGSIIANPASFGTSGVLGASYVLIVLAIVSQVIFLVAEYGFTPSGLRRRPARASSGAEGALGDATGDDHYGIDQVQNQQRQLHQGSTVE